MIHLVKRKMRAILNTSDVRIAPKINAVLMQSGKFTRANIILDRCNNAGVDEDQAITAAAVVELMHLSSLIIDDLIDKARTRRGTASAPTVLGKRSAGLVGAWMLLKAMDAARNLNDEFCELLYSASVSMCESEIWAESIEGVKPQAVSEIMLHDINRGKTAVLFAVCYATANVLSNVCHVHAYAQGLEFGEEYQLEDDIKDYATGATGRTAGHDYKRGIVTLPRKWAVSAGYADTIHGVQQYLNDEQLAVE